MSACGRCCDFAMFTHTRSLGHRLLRSRSLSLPALKDVTVRARLDKRWSAAVGIENLNTYWAFHPYAKRTVVAEMKYDW